MQEWPGSKSGGEGRGKGERNFYVRAIRGTRGTLVHNTLILSVLTFSFLEASSVDGMRVMPLRGPRRWGQGTGILLQNPGRCMCAWGIMFRRHENID
jgi:hypothetical protein